MTAAPVSPATGTQPGPPNQPAARGGRVTGAPPQSLVRGARVPGSTSSGRIRAIARRLLHGTPGRMRTFGALAVLAALALGASSASALLQSRAAVSRAANNTAQVVRVQSIHVDLLRADAVATNAFLVGGLEPPQQRAQYDAAMSRVARNLAEAAAAQPADGKALGALSDEVQQYAALVEQARSNNRLGLPVGAQYLRQASAGLRSDAIPIVTVVGKANEDRAAAEFRRADSRWLLTIGAVGVVVLIGVAVWLARRTHRYLNASLAGAALLLLVSLAVSASGITRIDRAASMVARDQYAEAVALAQVRTAANDARSNESLTLIARGSGAAFEKAWKADDTLVRTSLGRAGVDASREWNAYVAAHEEVRKLDDAGQWDAAVARATSSARDGSSTVFDQFDHRVTAARDRASAAATGELDGVGRSAPFLAALMAVAALLASWLVVRGIAQRIEEYR